jgi:hypothetical protein
MIRISFITVELQSTPAWNAGWGCDCNGRAQDRP